MLSLSSCKNETSAVDAINAPILNYPLNEQRRANITYSDSGKNVLEIKAGLVQDYGNMEPPYTFFSNGLTVRFYNGRMLSSTVLNADTARQEKSTDLWLIGGNVIVRNGKGDRLLTELLFWDKKEEKLYTDRKVQIETDGQRIIGVGFEADQEFNNYQIFSVQGELTIYDE
ncbi:MAG: LPS export ABC transporter periplasmic protein LptC [Bacteroidota bacterium]|nr:LPS export ABC transporter periplasmic protein LptC [Bacteroidota bacterium]